MSATLWISLLLTAHAHRPHSVITAMALAPDFEESGEVWTVMDPHDIAQPMLSVDHGRHWEFIGGAPMDDELIGGAFLGDTLLLLARDGTLWGTDDQGSSWESEEVLDSTLAQAITVDGDQVIIGTRNGVFTGTPGEAFSVIGENNSYLEVEASPTDASSGVAVTELGVIWSTSDGWETLDRAKDNPRGLFFYDATQVNGNVFGASDTAVVARFDLAEERWEDCASLPRESTESYASDVTKLDGTADGRVIVATAREALFVSDDDCETWEKWDSQVVPIFGGIGNATSPEEGFTEIAVVGDHGLVGGFSGIATAHTEGGDWTDSKLIPGDYCRGIAFAPRWPDDPRLFVGAYGGGVWWTANGGASYDGSAIGMDGVYSYDVQPAEDLKSSGVLYYSGSNNPYRSEDDGETWTRFELPMDRVRLFRPYGNRVYALGEDQTDAVYGQVAYSDDGGNVWAEFPGDLYDKMERAAPRDIQETALDGDSIILVVVDSPAGILVSGDAGASWASVYAGEKETAAGGTAWPVNDPTRLVFAAPSTGVIWSDDGGDTWTDAASPPSGRPRHMTQADDGTLLLATRDGQIWLSDDGGESWTAVGEPIKPAIFDLVAGPEFATWGAALVGTQAGPFWTADAGETWSRLPRYERYEDRSVHFECWKGGVEDGANPCDTYSDTDQGFGGGYALQAGDQLRFTFEGDEFAVVGAQDGDGSVTVDISGADQPPLVADGTKLRVSGLEPGWKDVRLTVADAGADGFRIDLIETWGEGEVMPIDGVDTGTADSGGPDDTGDPCVEQRCGCGGGGSSCALVLLLPLWWRRREWR